MSVVARRTASRREAGERWRFISYLAAAMSTTHPGEAWTEGQILVGTRGRVCGVQEAGASRVEQALAAGSAAAAAAAGRLGGQVQMETSQRESGS